MQLYASIILSIIGKCKNHFQVLTFWGDNETLTAADCASPSKGLKYSNRAVSISDITVNKPILL